MSSTTGSLNTFDSPSTGYNQFTPASSNLLAQGTKMGGASENWLYAIPLALLIWMIAEGLDTTGNGGTPSGVLDETLEIKPPIIIADIPDGGNDGGPENPATSIPSPALLPGLIGMGAAAIRKRNRIAAEQV